MSTADTLRTRRAVATLSSMNEPVIYREEVVALLFNVSTIMSTLERIETLLEDGDGEEGNES